MVLTETKKLTADEFETLGPEYERFELDEGVLVEMVPPGEEHGDVAAELVSRLRSFAKEHRLGRVVVETGYVDDRTLGSLYRRATVFAFPSLFEGFAMPPIEALGLGLPVLTTRAASIPEVTMGIAAYVDDPRDPKEMADRLDAMLADPEAARPSADDVARIRDAYDPVGIATRYREVLTGS